VKFSASREMTTPLNFIFDPLGTDRVLGAAAVVVFETCPETSDVAPNNRARPQMTTND